jgi:hypothetical protein
MALRQWSLAFFDIRGGINGAFNKWLIQRQIKLYVSYSLDKVLEQTESYRGYRQLCAAQSWSYHGAIISQNDNHTTQE